MSCTSADILAKLDERFPSPEWATFGELRDLAGFAAHRTIDFFAMHTWASKGFRRVAVEVKVSRADFMREIEDPSKREPWIVRSNEFYFAVPTGLVKPDEVPEECGLFECGKTLRRTKVAMQRKLSDDSLSPSFVAVLLRNAASRARNENLELRRRIDQFSKFEGRDVSLDEFEQAFEERNEVWRKHLDDGSMHRARIRLSDEIRKALWAAHQLERIHRDMRYLVEALGRDADDKSILSESVHDATRIVAAAMRSARDVLHERRA